MHRRTQCGSHVEGSERRSSRVCVGAHLFSRAHTQHTHTPIVAAVLKAQDAGPLGSVSVPIAPKDEALTSFLDQILFRLRMGDDMEEFMHQKVGSAQVACVVCACVHMCMCVCWQLEKAKVRFCVGQRQREMIQSRLCAKQ